MKVTAFFTAALMLLLYIISGSGYLNMLTWESEQKVFAYTLSQQDNIQMKPISRGGVLERKKHDVKLQLMTFNIHRGIGRNGKLDLDAVAEVIKTSKAAVVGLQEVERNSIRTAFQDQIKLISEKTEMNYAYGKSMKILNWEYGNGLLSRFPIEEYKAFELPSFSEQRTVLRTVINVNGIKLAVYNTHLGLKEAERKQQAEFIMQMISEEKLEYILMGDMNSKAGSLSVITDLMQDSAQDSKSRQLATFEEDGVQERIDYIFVSPKIEVTSYDVVQSDASDHYPVISEIVVRE